MLQRRCRHIIVVDGEADPGMTFSSLITAQRYARIDLGTRIDIDVSRIKSATMAAGKEMRSEKPKSGEALADPLEERPHCAIGRIYYPKDDKGKPQEGVILYIKSSLTGDENDYVCDYGRRHSSFPHETTGNQFFSEEQFEVYRALGFHAAYKAMSGAAVVQMGKDLVTLPGPSNKVRKPGNKVSKTVQIWQELFSSVDHGY